MPEMKTKKPGAASMIGNWRDRAGTMFHRRQPIETKARVKNL
jgi:hypothetical protein